MRSAIACVLLVLAGGPAAEGEARQAPIEAAIAGLASPDPMARALAMRELDRLGSPEAAEPVSVLARDPEDGIQLEAIDVTLHLLLGERAAGGRGRPAQGGGLAAFDADLAPVVATPPAVFANLASAMGDLDLEVRRHAASAFAVLAGARPATVPEPTMAVAERALLVMLGAVEPDARITAARVAGRLYRASLPGAAPGGARPVPAAVGDRLIALLNQPTELERLVAMEALGLAREDRAVAALAERHTYHRRAGPALERAATLDALSRLGHPSSVPFLAEALNDRWDAVRQIGYEGLARSRARDQAAVHLGRSTADRSANVRLAQADARERLLADGALDEIVEGLRSSRQRSQAEGYLLELGPASTSAIAARLSHPNASVRAALAEVLGRIGTGDAAAALTPLASDPNREVAAAAARAVRRLEAGLSSGTGTPR